MAAISVRLPEELEIRLTHEAEIEGKPRSELAREAIAEYLARREKERFMKEMVSEARAAYSNEAIRQEVREMDEDFLPFSDKALDDDTTDESGEKWWK
jgi:predicted DNA-binding protein